MAITRQDKLEMFRNTAQYFTMTVAVLYGILWIIVELSHKQSASTDKLGYVLLLATMVGGVTMGLLYALHLSRKK